MAFFSVGSLSERRRQMGLRTLKQCAEAPYPTLVDLARAYGTSECPMLLLEAYITNLNDSCNAARMDEAQISEAGTIMFGEAPYLKLTEVHEFFRRVKAGYYGEYYGSIDVLKIMTDFRLFLKDRAEAVRRIEAERNRRKRNEEWDRRQKEWENAHPDNV